jgi:hypothetical protein
MSAPSVSPLRSQAFDASQYSSKDEALHPMVLDKLHLLIPCRIQAGSVPPTVATVAVAGWPPSQRRPRAIVTGGRIGTMHLPECLSGAALLRQNWQPRKPQSLPPGGAWQLPSGRLQFLPRPGRPAFLQLGQPAPLSVEESLCTIRLRRAGQVASVWPAGQTDDLGYGRARLIVRPVGIDEDKRSAGDVLDLN